MDDSSKEAVVSLILLLIAIAGIVTLFGFNWGKTYTGIVDTTDCRATVTLNQGDSAILWHKFYCSDRYCTAISTTENGQCTTSYSYKQSD